MFQTQMKKIMAISLTLVIGTFVPMIVAAQQNPAQPALQSPVVIYDDIEVIGQRNAAEPGNLYVKGGANGGLYIQYGLTLLGNLVSQNAQGMRLFGGAQINGRITSSGNFVTLRDLTVNAAPNQSPAVLAITTGTVTVNGTPINLSGLSGGGLPADAGTLALVTGTTTPNISGVRWENSIATCPPRGRVISCDTTVLPTQTFGPRDDLEIVETLVNDPQNGYNSCSVFGRNGNSGTDFKIEAKAHCFVLN